LLLDPPFNAIARLVADFAARSRLPVISILRRLAEAGSLIATARGTTETTRRAVLYVDKILRGAKPADLPVEQPTKLDLVLNLKTAKTLGLAIPPSGPRAGGRGDPVGEAGGEYGPLRPRALGVLYAVGRWT
jgi:putative ABC transport system substrate-binding protein